MPFRARGSRSSAGFVRGGILVTMASVAAAVALIGTTATAKSDYSSPYGYDKTWNAALRMVRVDLGFKVLEKDDASGYLLFEYRSPESGPKPTSGSLEFVRPSGAGEVKVVAQIPQMPRYHEQVLLDDLARKMHDEYGEPPAPRKAPPPPPPDAGADASDDEDNEHIVPSDEDNEHLVGKD